MPGRPPKAKGYRGEIKARDELRALGLHKIERTGSLNYKDSAPDLTQGGDGDLKPVRIVATQDDRAPMLYTLSAEDLGFLMGWGVASRDLIPVVVQVKKHKQTWIGGLYRKLVANS